MSWNKYQFRLQKSWFKSITDYVNFNYFHKLPDGIKRLSELKCELRPSTYIDPNLSTIIASIEDIDSLQGIILDKDALLEGTTGFTFGIAMNRPFFLIYDGVQSSNALNLNYLVGAGITTNYVGTHIPFIGNLDFSPCTLHNPLRGYPNNAYKMPNENVAEFINGGFFHKDAMFERPIYYIQSSNWNYPDYTPPYVICNLSVDGHLTSSKYSVSDLMNIILTLKPLENETKTLKLGQTNLAKLTEEQIAIATKKGWTLS